jgi:hypothetical protein
MDAIWTLDEEQRAAMRQRMLEARREFLWDYPGSRVHERILQAAASYPRHHPALYPPRIIFTPAAMQHAGVDDADSTVCWQHPY